MNGNKIDKKKKDVIFTLSDGAEIHGEVYLRLYSTNRMGPQRIDELLNEGIPFIPVKTVDGFVLLNSTHIMLARTELDESSYELTMMSKQCRVTVTTTLHNDFEADLYLTLPEDFQRVKDYLNQPIQFFTFFLPEHILCVNRDFILSIQD